MMSHHAEYVDDNGAIAENLRRLLGQTEKELGATGQFPDGKIGKEDEGEIMFAVAADKKRGLVHVDFGKPVQWLALTVKQAADLGQALNAKAREAE